MNANDREIRRKQRILEHAVGSGNVAKTCRYFGIPRSSFYRWHKVYLEHGEEGLRCKKPIARRRQKTQHLLYHPAVDAEPTARLMMAQPFVVNRQTSRRRELHAVHLLPRANTDKGI